MFSRRTRTNARGTGGQLSRCIIQKSSKRNIAVRSFVPYPRLLFVETTSALFRKLAARKQIVPRSEPRGNTRSMYIVFIFMRIIAIIAQLGVIDTRVSDYRVNGILFFPFFFFSFFSSRFHDFFSLARLSSVHPPPPLSLSLSYSSQLIQ